MHLVLRKGVEIVFGNATLLFMRYLPTDESQSWFRNSEFFSPPTKQ
ncbi:hypothetical protein CCPUN_02090 [Cardinium endosymbiont of Culicoides punctatus]|nr:hypothetical protein CCPUN_02090 [Cardinium endosymbiont of Culicoides punctatus]